MRHDPGPGHPETPRRLHAVLERLHGELVASITPADHAPRAALLRVHPESYLDGLESLSQSGGGMLTADTTLNGASWVAALGAAGAVLAALDHALSGRGHAFAAVRPPGHHALAADGMGFCLINHVVVAARQAHAAGVERVLIVDWDVHHGNGTQALVEADPSVRYVSLHQWPWYPGTGAADERGVGNIFNVPRPAGLERERYVTDLWMAVEQATNSWPADLVLISAGFDAMRGDPLGGFTLEPADYATLTSRLRERLPDAPVVGVLEGGYAPERLADGVAAHVAALA